MLTQSDFETCRTLRHAWDVLSQLPASEYTPDVFCVLSLRCTRCTTERTDDLDVYGDLVRRKYDYPDGYQYSETDVTLTLQELRLKLMQRAPVRAVPHTPDETKTEEVAS